ncbi:alpha/beta hydrolase [Blastococcus sp. PRF04-17]|uniref:alpha/beta hydrolase n=1 Tax=Blastococcus sp. PRF04-17 TaxID=2933797 RepID=UPI001FF51184|nr:alpha/beta hydrolase [Blastococcus sp. PRF04-17]UOY02396.1 alpha/beta hydrolase [Blastococcus sp. PRF04-17]
MRTRALVALAAAATAAALARRARTLAPVAPELRTPALWVPLALSGKLTLAAGRKLYPRPTSPVDGVTVSRRDVPGGLDAFVYEPDGRTRPGGALLWIHGGGTIIGAPEGDHELCSRLARHAGVLVVSVRYRLAPEHPFPAGLDDCSAALRWLHAEDAEFGVDPSRVAVGGASAGGLLAASVVQRAHDEGVPVAFQALVYPMLDDRTVLRRDHGGRGGLIWTPRSNRYAWSCYLGAAPGTAEPPRHAVPARREDLTGLPPAWIGVGDLDLFHDEDLEYARRLGKAGVPVTVRVEPGMYHAAEVELHATAETMRAFREAMFDAVAAALA